MTDLDQKNASLPVYLVGAAADGAETTPVMSNTAGELLVSDVLHYGGVQGALSVGSTAVAARVGLVNHSGRKVLTVMPTSGNIFWGYTSAVTPLSGTVIYKKQQVTFSVSDVLTIWLIAVATCDVRITEGS